MGDERLGTSGSVRAGIILFRLTLRILIAYTLTYELKETESHCPIDLSAVPSPVVSKTGRRGSVSALQIGTMEY